MIRGDCPLGTIGHVLMRGPQVTPGYLDPRHDKGAMLSDGRQFLQLAPHVAISPGLAILITVLALNLLGDGLRDALDPKMKKNG